MELLWFLSRKEVFYAILCQIKHINGSLRGYCCADTVLKLIGHIWNNKDCILKSEKDLKKDGTGSYDGAVEKNTVINKNCSIVG